VADKEGPRTPLHLLSWNDPSVVAVALLAMASGFGQFGVVAALGDVAKTFGHFSHGNTLADQAGLSGTILGVGLAIIRLASLAGLPLAGFADRVGRRPMLLWSCAVGLALTVTASLSPSYWWFVAIFAAGRPFLSAVNGVAQVVGAELTPSAHRAKAVALIAAGYGIGAGLAAIIHSLSQGLLGFRFVFALAAVPLICLPLLARRLVEPDRFVNVGTHVEPPVFGPVEREYRGRLIIVAAVVMAVSVITGPATSFVYFYAQNVRHLSGVVTAAMVAAAGVAGLFGLLLGRWMADRLGRRPTIALAMVAMGVFGVFSYSGSSPAVFIGYALGVLGGSIFAPAGGSLVNELFPTAVRASVSGWLLAVGVVGAVIGLIVFGAVADVNNRFSIAAVVTFLPVVPVSLLLWKLPETKGTEPEDLWGSGFSST